MKSLTASEILLIHEDVIFANELQGLAQDKSLDAVVGRVENRINYGLVEDVYDLAATYAVVISVGHVFNDANKRTAHSAMEMCLQLNGVVPNFEIETIGQVIVNVAQGNMDEIDLARYLRAHFL